MGDPLHLAIRKDDVEKAFSIVTSQGANLAAVDMYGCVPLHYAISKGLTSLSLALIEAGAGLNVKNKNGNTPLLLAIYGGHTVVAMALISKKEAIAVDATDPTGRTALHFAARIGDIAVAKALIEAGANVSTANSSGDIPLHVAINNNNEEMIAMLLQARSPLDVMNSNGHSPLHSAILKNNLSSVNMLVAARAAAVRFPAKSTTPLHLALENRRSQACALALITGGTCDVKAANKEGRTPLHMAVSLGISSLVYALMKAGADVTDADSAGVTPLHLVTDAHVAKILLSSNASMSAKDITFRTPLHYAIAGSMHLIVKVFINYGAGGSGADGLYCQEGARYYTTGNYFITNPSMRSINPPTTLEGSLYERHQTSSLHLAVMFGNITFIDQFLKCGADIDAMDQSGMTPLHRAAIIGNPSVIKCLVAEGADVSICTRDSGKTALHLLKERAILNDQKIYALLEGKFE